MIVPCSCGESRAKAPVRRSGYQIAHGHAGFSAVRRGRRSSQSSRSVSKPDAYVRPSIVNSGLSEQPGEGLGVEQLAQRPSTKNAGSSLMASTPTPRGSLTSW